MSVLKFRLGLVGLLITSSLSVAHAAVKLPAVDCAKTQDARCRPASSNTSGGVGGGDFGLSFGGFSDRVGSGFVDEAENAAYLPLETLGQMDGFGGAIRVDLATGNRTLVSGRLDDQMPMRGKGLSYVNYRGEPATAWGLGRVMVVRSGLKPGTVLAMQHYGSETRTVVLEINKATGDRTIVWSNRLADDSARSTLETSIQNIEAKLGINAETGCNRVAPEPVSMEVYKGQLYVFGKSAVYRVQPGKSCTVVSNYDVDGNSLAGSGDAPQPSVLSGSWLDGNRVTFTSGPGRTYLLSTDLDTGARKLVSAFDEHSPARLIGKGTGNIGYLGAHVATKTYVVMTGFTGEKSFYYTRVDKKTGDRAVMEGKGSLSRGNSSTMSVVTAIPGTDKALVWWEGALHVLDAATGWAYVLSQ